MQKFNDVLKANKPEDNIDYGDKVFRKATSLGQWGYIVGMFLRSDGTFCYMAEALRCSDFMFYGPAEEFSLVQKMKTAIDIDYHPSEQRIL